MDYDLITVGGGLGGAALAKAMAEQGARVLVVEREAAFRDRVRGEGMHPWGVAEARALGLYDLLLERCAIEASHWWNILVGFPPTPPRDLVATTPHRAGSLNFYHPEMQEIVLDAAAAAGAEVRRGSAVVGVTPGTIPSIMLQQDGGAVEQYAARMVVGADGRASHMRRWAGFTVNQDPQRLMIAGLLLTGLRLPEDTIPFTLNTALGQGTIIFPLGRERYRTYVIWRAANGPRRLSGAQHVPDFLAACQESGVKPEQLAAAEAAGPLAAYSGADSWVDHPYREGVALIGDAAAASDPSFGCGLALTLRDVRVLRDQLLATSDWDAAGHAYATERDCYYAALHRIETWLGSVLFEVGPEADARRMRVLPRLAQERERAPDIIGLGPDGPNAAADLQYFG